MTSVGMAGTPGSVVCRARLLVVLLTALRGCPGEMVDAGNAFQLRQMLFTNYSRQIKPRQDQSQSVSVHMSVSYASLLDMDSVKEHMKSLLFITFWWTDDFLQWDPRDCGNITRLFADVTDLWHPDVNVVNEVYNPRVLDTIRSRVPVTSRGHVKWEVTVTTSTRCDLDMTLFPFDWQRCEIRFYFNLPVSENYLESVSAQFNDFFKENGEWSRQGISHEKIIRQFSENYTAIFVNVVLRRRPGYYVINAVLPMIVLSLLGNMAFFVSVETNDKVGFALTVLLSQAVFMSFTSTLMPKTSDELPYLTLYLVSILVVNAVSVVACLYVTHIFHRPPTRPRGSLFPHLVKLCGHSCSSKPGSARKEQLGSPTQTDNSSSHGEDNSSSDDPQLRGFHRFVVPSDEDVVQVFHEPCHDSENTSLSSPHAHTAHTPSSDWMILTSVGGAGERETNEESAEKRKERKENGGKQLGVGTTPSVDRRAQKTGDVGVGNSQSQTRARSSSRLMNRSAGGRPTGLTLEQVIRDLTHRFHIITPTVGDFSQDGKGNTVTGSADRERDSRKQAEFDDVKTKRKRAGCFGNKTNFPCESPGVRNTHHQTYSFWREASKALDKLFFLIFMSFLCAVSLAYFTATCACRSEHSPTPPFSF